MSHDLARPAPRRRRSRDGLWPVVPVLDDVNRALTRVPSAPLLRHDGDRVCASRAYARRQEAPVGAG